MLKEEFPVSEKLKVIKGKTLFKSDKWWSAVVALESFGRKQICIYLWQKAEDKWKRRQKFVVRGKSQWTEIKEAVEKMLPRLTGEPEFQTKEV